MLVKFIILAVLSFIVLNGTANAYIFLASKEFENSGIDLEVDPYYTALSYYSGIFTKSTTCLAEEQEESKIYKYLFSQAYLPKFFLVEASCYPLPCAGVAIRKNYFNEYKKSQSSPDTNWVEVACSGFEEPYAYSVFLGNIVTFKPKNIKKDVSGKAYMGYLASVGDYHIKQSVLIPDNWYEAEWKVKGDRFSNDRLMKWSYRIGTKQHENPFIKDVVYFSVLRERVDFEPHRKSFFDNIRIEYRIDIDYSVLAAIRHYFMIGKSYPVKNKKFAFHTDFGFYLEKAGKYSGDLKDPDNKDVFSLMFRPNIKF